MKAHKYVSKVRTKSGKWRYIYKDVPTSQRSPTTPNSSIMNAAHNAAYQQGYRNYQASRLVDGTRRAINDWDRWSANNRRLAVKGYKAWSSWSEKNRKTLVNTIKAAKTAIDYIDTSHKEYKSKVVTNAYNNFRKRKR